MRMPIWGVVKWLREWYTMAEKKRTDCVWILKDILKKKDEERSMSHAPAGAQPTFWMFVLPEVPKDDFNEVYSNILLGNRKIALDKERLKQVGVTHVVNTAQGTRFNQIDTSPEFYAEVEIDFLGIPGQDVSSFKLSKYFRDTAEFIDKAINSGGKVYIHCMQGVSRSATITIAYLMLKKNLTVVEAVTEVRNKRAIFPNDGFLHQLSELNEKLYGLAKA